MADQRPVQNIATPPSDNRRGGRKPRGAGANRSRNSTQGGGGGNTDGNGSGSRGRAGNFRRGRGGRGENNNYGPLTGESSAAKESSPQKTTLRVASGAPSITANPKADQDIGSDSEPVCFICADPVKYSAVAPCNHVTCHICSLRMRALYKNKACAHCRTESEYVIFSKYDKKRYEDFQESEIISRNDLLGIRFDDQVIQDDTTLLLRYNCPEGTCDHACMGWKDLEGHVKHQHGRVMCGLCIRHKKVFTHEHTLFTTAALRRHERHGDDQPGAENQSGFKGHPDCKFCQTRFYSVDELFEHCKANHERCHICDRASQGRNPQYFFNYDSLEEHFKESHFLCTDQDCLEMKFVVFENEIDLKAHQLKDHPNGLTKEEIRDARRIDLSHFEDARRFTPPSVLFQRRGRGGIHNARGQHEIDEGPMMTELHMGRQEIAFHRAQQLAIQSAQSHTMRSFGGQLSAVQPSSAVPAARQQQPARTAPEPASAPLYRPPSSAPGPTPGPTVTVAATDHFPTLPSRSQPPRPSQPAQPAQNSMSDEDRRIKHMAVIERASKMLRLDAKKIELFRNFISRFRLGAISGGDLIDLLWKLFDVTPQDFGTLAKELAELYEDENKKRELLKAWNSWKVDKDDYPPIAGASSFPPPSASSNRVLKLKSSTACSSRSNTAQETSWGTASVAATPSSSSSPFPNRAQTNPNRVGKGAVTATAWVSNQTSTASSSSSAVSKSMPSSSSSTTSSPVRSTRLRDDFPSLPAKRQVPGWSPVPAKSRWETTVTSPASNPWAAVGSSNSNGNPQENVGSNLDDGADSNTSGKKKKGKQKQLLLHVGL